MKYHHEMGDIRPLSTQVMTPVAAAPKLFFRVMELIPTSARPWQGDTNMCFFFTKQNGDLTVET